MSSLQSVLVIDDSPDVHALLKVRLRSEELVLTHALDAVTGIRMAQEAPPDLVLLDVEMPGVSGFDACQVMKDDARLSAVPIIFLTGVSDLVKKVRGFELGAVDYVTKPFEPAELRARVRAALRTKRFQDLLATRAQIDALTGLWNRAHFDRRLSELVSRAARGNGDLALVMVDIDHFKKHNDLHGHPFGDRVIQHVADVLLASVRETDSACRYGGEEFALLLTDTDPAGARVAAERVRAAIGALDMKSAGANVPVSASFGVSASGGFPSPRRASAGALVAAADRALYTAKRAGRDRVCLADLASYTP